MALIVQKYGGTSVATLGHMVRVAGHIKKTVGEGHRVIVTISAMGQQTDDLLAMAHDLHDQPPRRELDMLLTTGERTSAALLAIALDRIGVLSVSLTGSQCGILTDDTHGNARITTILGDRIRQGIDAKKVVIVAGFQGVSPQTKEITTLGRGGSDLSAIAIAAAMKADVCQLYKDVRGIYTTDPREVSEARLIPELTVRSMMALTWGGSGVVHTRAIHLASKYHIPVEVRSSLELEEVGTLIVRGKDAEAKSEGSLAAVNPDKTHLKNPPPQKSENHAMEQPVVEALTDKKKLVYITLVTSLTQSRNLWNELQKWLWQEGESPIVKHGYATGQAALESATASANLNASGTGLEPIKSQMAYEIQLVISEDVGEELAVLPWIKDQGVLKHWVPGLCSVTVVGQGFKQSPELIEKILGLLPEVPHYFSVQHDSVTIVVDEQLRTNLVAHLHRHLLEGN